MRLLLDTHCWLWMLAAPTKLDEDTRALLVDPSVELLLSAASSWEIAITHALGKPVLPAAPADYVPARMEATGVRGLPVEHRHALHVAALPPHHRDPFDRVLVAQAQLEELTLVTADQQLAPYDVDLRLIPRS